MVCIAVRAAVEVGGWLCGGRVVGVLLCCVGIGVVVGCVVCGVVFLCLSC